KSPTYQSCTTWPTDGAWVAPRRARRTARAASRSPTRVSGATSVGPVEGDHPGTAALDHLGVVAGDEHRPTGRGMTGEPVPEPGSPGVVESLLGLVGEEQGPGADHRRGEREALCLARGQRPRQLVGDVLDAGL